MTYHQDPRLSASKLKAYLQHDPAVAHYMDAHPTPPTDAMRMGTALHALMEGQQLTISPFTEYRTNEAKAWRDAHPEALKQSEANEVLAWQQAIMGELYQQDLLDVYGRSQSEVEIYNDRFKAKIDALCDDIVLDWKTSACTNLQQLYREMHANHWHLQASHYVEMAKAKRFIFVVVSKVAPHPVWCVEVSHNGLEYGQTLKRRALALRDSYLLGERGGIVDLDAPSWARLDDSEVEF
jgi:hypothetical protein